MQATAKELINLGCAVPHLPPSKQDEALKFAEQFAETTSNFSEALHLPSPIDSSVLFYGAQTRAYYIKDLEDSKLVQPFIQNSVEGATKGSPITVDKSAVIQDISNFINSFVGGAKATASFSGFSSATYPGTFGGKDVLYKVIIAVYTTDVSELYESKSKSVVELAYFAYLVVQKAQK